MTRYDMKHLKSLEQLDKKGSLSPMGLTRLRILRRQFEAEQGEDYPIESVNVHTDGTLFI